MSGDFPKLSVVMPVYNEAGAIGEVLAAWIDEIRRLSVDFELRVYDDGSSDGTPEIVRESARRQPEIVALRHANRGHGPTILRGYREARGDWIFQVDSDDELPTGGFPQLWQERQGHDLLLGWRRNRLASHGRRLMSAVSRLAVRGLFGAGIRDVNTPYRLFRRSALQELLPRVPEDAFAPNVILSGLAVRAGCRIYQTPVDFRQRRTGTALASARLWQGAARSFGELLRTAAKGSD